MNKNTLNFYTDDGIERNVSVIDIFGLQKYPNKQYIVYTFNDEEKLDDDMVCISELVETEDAYQLKTIENEEEWNELQVAIKEFENELDEGDKSATI